MRQQVHLPDPAKIAQRMGEARPPALSSPDRPAAAGCGSLHSPLRFIRSRRCSEPRRNRLTSNRIENSEPAATHSDFVTVTNWAGRPIRSDRQRDSVDAAIHHREFFQLVYSNVTTAQILSVGQQVLAVGLRRTATPGSCQWWSTTILHNSGRSLRIRHPITLRRN